MTFMKSLYEAYMICMSPVSVCDMIIAWTNYFIWFCVYSLSHFFQYFIVIEMLYTKFSILTIFKYISVVLNTFILFHFVKIKTMSIKQ